MTRFILGPQADRTACGAREFTLRSPAHVGGAEASTRASGRRTSGAGQPSRLISRLEHRGSHHQDAAPGYPEVPQPVLDWQGSGFSQVTPVENGPAVCDEPHAPRLDGKSLAVGGEASQAQVARS